MAPLASAAAFNPSSSNRVPKSTVDRHAADGRGDDAARAAARVASAAHVVRHGPLFKAPPRKLLSNCPRLRLTRSQRRRRHSRAADVRTSAGYSTGDRSSARRMFAFSGTSFDSELVYTLPNESDLAELMSEPTAELSPSPAPTITTEPAMCRCCSRRKLRSPGSTKAQL